jgi:peptide/nickel transport system ATP-binding protein
MVFGNPLHPYTQQLLRSVPRLHEKWGSVVAAAGTAQSCCYHDALAAHPATGGTGMAEMEPGHLVGCANLVGLCPGDTDIERAIA